MKVATKFSAVKFRFILITLMTIVTILIIGIFIFGYRYMQSVGEDTARRQADATASEDSVGALQRLKIQLTNLEGVSEKISELRSSNNMPQFDTEKSLRTIASQLGLNVINVTFVDSADAASTEATPTPAAASTISSLISFQFDRPLSYQELIRFLDAIETSTPKLSIESINIPEGSARGAIDLGTLTLELATN